MENFVVITMLTKTDKTLYLEMIDGKAVWTFNKADACYFEHITQAEKFAKKWFKHFNGWNIEPISVNLNEL